MNECSICQNSADYILIDGGYYLCGGCIKSDKIDKF